MTPAALKNIQSRARQRAVLLLVRLRVGRGEEIAWIQGDQAPFLLLTLEPALHNNLPANEDTALAFTAYLEQPVQLHSLNTIVTRLTDDFDGVAQFVLRRQRPDVGGEPVITRHGGIDCPQEHIGICFAESRCHGGEQIGQFRRRVSWRERGGCDGKQKEAAHEIRYDSWR
jgi:hypothetical protein